MNHKVKELERREEIRLRCAARRAQLLQGHHLNEEVWAEVFGESAFDLGDGWARIFALNKLGVLHVFKRVRLRESWLSVLLEELPGLKEMTRWPGNLKKSNPWRVPYFTRVIVAAPECDKETGQFKVVFPLEEKSKFRPSQEELARKYRANRGKKQEVFTGTTFYFEGGVNKAQGMEGWLIPRRQQRSRPWTQGDGVLHAAPVERLFVPDLTDEERVMLLNGNKAGVIRRLHVKHAEDIKAKVWSVIDIKEGVEKLLEALQD